MKEKETQENFYEQLMLLAKEKDIEPELLIDKIRTAISIAVRKEYPRSENVKFEVDKQSGSFNVYLVKEIVEEVEDDANQMTLDEAKKLEKKYTDAKNSKIIREISEESGKSRKRSAKKSADELSDEQRERIASLTVKPRKYDIGDSFEIPLDTRDFGRISAQTAKQVMKQGIKDVERNKLIEQWGELQDEMVTVKVLKVEPVTGNATVELDGNEVPFFRSEQLPGDELHAGDFVKVYVNGASPSDKRPMLKVSRTHRDLIKRLFEAEVPEIFDGIVQIKSISREAGQRSKMAVFSNDPNVDALGACIGAQRSRISKICEELKGEKIDIVIYSDDPKEFIKQALKPAEVLSVDIPDEEVKACTVVVPDNQLSLAIGNKGQNAKLAARLTGFKIDIKPESGFFEG